MNSSLPKPNQLKMQVRTNRRRQRRGNGFLQQRQQSDSILTLRSLQARLPIPFPVSRTVDLPFDDFTNLAATASNNVSTVRYGLNALYDPKMLGTGDYQPYGFNTLALLYGRYIVTSVFMDLEFFDPSVDGLTVGFKLGGSDPSGQQINVAVQQPFTAMQTISNSGDQRAHFQIGIPLHQIVGITPGMWRDEQNQYGAAVSANPTQIPKLTVWVGGVGSGTPTVRYNLRLVYRARLYDRTTLSASQVA